MGYKIEMDEGKGDPQLEELYKKQWENEGDNESPNTNMDILDKIDTLKDNSLFTNSEINFIKKWVQVGKYSESK